MNTVESLIELRDVKNVLITRTDRMGDVILTLPLAGFAKSIFKESRIKFLARKYVADLIGNYPEIDEVIYYDEFASFKDKYKFFKSRKIDLVIFAKPEFELAVLFFLLRVRYRIGSGYRWYSFLFNRKVYEHRKTSEKHESEYNLNLLKNFFPEVSFEKTFHFKYTDTEKSGLSEKLTATGLDMHSDYIVIHPGSGNSAKDLPVETLNRFACKFSKKYPGFKIVITGTEPEKLLAETFVKSENQNLIDLTGGLNLKELMILIDNARLFISNSTGPIHLAGALNKNIIGFYPNKKPSNEERWGPLSENAIILKPSGEDDNMSDINEDDLIVAANKFLA